MTGVSAIFDDFDRFFKAVEGLTSKKGYEQLLSKRIGSTNKGSWIELAGTLPKVDVLKKDNMLKVVFPVHGYDKEDLKLTVNDVERTLSLSTGKLKSYKKEDDEEFLVNEIKQSSVKRTLVVPDNVDLSRIDTKYKDGYLICTMPTDNTMKNERLLSI